MEAIKKYLRKYGVVAVIGLFVAFFVVEVGAMRMSPQQGKAFAARRAAQEKGVQVQPARTEAEKKQELEEAFMSDADYAVAQRVKTLKPGEFFIYESGTADGI